MSKKVLEALAVTAELMGNEISPPAAQVMYSDLSVYDEGLVMDALVRVRREVKGRLCIADIIDRIDDGRPGVEEAWAMMPFSELTTVVWTDEMQRAFSVCYSLLDAGDMVAARMAFKEAYSKEIRKAKTDGRVAVWNISLGHDYQGRESVIKEAFAKGLISASSAKAIGFTFDDTPALTDGEMAENQKKLAALMSDIVSNNNGSE